MAGLLDFLLSGGALGLPPAATDFQTPDPRNERPYLGRGPKIGGPRGQSGVLDPSALLASLLMPSASAYDPSGGALPSQFGPAFGEGAQAQSLYNVNPSGFGFAPPAPAPAPILAPPGMPGGAPAAPNLGPPIGVSPLPTANVPAPRGTPQPDTVLPPTAQPTAGRNLSAPAPDYGPVGALAGAQGGNLGAAFANFAGGGNLIDRLIHSGLGAATGQRTDPLGYSQQMQQATYQALRSAGYAHADAALAATNPEVMKALVTNAYQQPKFEKAAPGEAAYLVGGGLGRLGPGGGGPSGVSGAGVTQLTPGMSVEQKAEAEAQGATNAANYKGLQSQAEAAIAQRQTIARLRQLSPQAYSGPAAPAIQHVRSLLVAAGIPSNAVKAGEEFSALSNKMVIEGLGGSLGTGISNADRSYISNTVPTLANTEPGRRQMIENADKLNERKIEILKQADQYKEAHNGSLGGFTTYLSQWAEQHPLFTGTAQGGSAQVGGNWTQVTPNIRVRPVQ